MAKFRHSLSTDQPYWIRYFSVQCGLNSGEHVGSFMRIGGALLKEKVVAAAAGITFSVFLTDTGKVYAVGSGANGQLGNGKVSYPSALFHP